MTTLPARPDTISHELLGLTQPSQQRNWADDDEWLEFGGCDVITRDHNFHVTGGVMLERNEDPEEKSPAEVLIAWFDLSNGDSGRIDMEPEEARKLARRLLDAADDAEANARGARLTTFEIMEERRAQWHRREARRSRARDRKAKKTTSN